MLRSQKWRRLRLKETKNKKLLQLLVPTLGPRRPSCPGANHRGEAEQVSLGPLASTHHPPCSVPHAVQVSGSPTPFAGSKVRDRVLQSGSDLLQAKRQLLVLGCRILVQGLDDLRRTAGHVWFWLRARSGGGCRAEALPRRSTCWRTGTAGVRPPECSACPCAAAEVRGHRNTPLTTVPPSRNHSWFSPWTAPRGVCSCPGR